MSNLDMYLSPFKDIKPHLKRVFLDTSKLSPLLSKIDYIKSISIKHDESSVVPYVYVVGSIGYINVNKCLILEPKEHSDSFIHIGYKRADELLDHNGLAIHRSKSVAYRIFKLKYPSLLPRLWHFLKFIVSK
jgi:hypothetical protein